MSEKNNKVKYNLKNAKAFLGAIYFNSKEK